MTIIGMGPGNVDLLSTRAIQVIEQAPVLIGSKRLIECFPEKVGVVGIKTQDIIDQLRTNPEAVVLMSGDTGFFSGAKQLMDAFPEAEIIPGISSLSYFCSRIGTSYEDITWLSRHGRTGDILSQLLRSSRLFVLTDKRHSPYHLAQALPEDIRSQTRFIIGENLSLEDEIITSLLASEVLDRDYASLCVVLMDYLGPTPPLLLRDEEIVRGEVPMTKEDIRALALLKLDPRPGETMIDVGSGTGSISLALARLGIKVHALEKNQAAIAVFRKNLARLGGDIELHEGKASDSIPRLPKAQAAFIGGSGGELSRILEQLRMNNPDMRLVISAITLETLTEVTRLTQSPGLELIDATLIQVSQAKQLGSYHLMQAKNPIYLLEVRFV